ncbi:TAXI family TRAP transporter solute-binding subunit [Miniphocaeibacter halophilus]|uniref:TAXI family TRAP transporter solute-binding subunit n=1 Tax=Miniphocaeibacter halophilus TaxID=2931922 RepID=A0AC61MSW4_9FIRM|nr:TAXI family TRAP transporter solute-binding subunit [Miniphocaeibacter halophilus]QQK08755.1 TAXI family TRAP transporter solute-binding subunit [Miniphocaeibacter halophilus]
MKRKCSLFLLVVLLLFSVTSCGKSSNTKKYSVGGGSVGGNFYLMGGGVANTLNNYINDKYIYSAETTGGSSANLVMLQDGNAEFGISMTASIAEAIEGKAKWTDGKSFDKLRGGLALYPSWLTIYTLKSSGIETLDDLNGKVVGLGSKGMAMDSVFREFFESRGIKPSQIHNDGHSATATAIDNGIVDAAVLFSYPPFASISELESTKDLNFVELSEEEQKELVDTYSFYTASDMPGGSYKAAKDDIRSVSEWNMLVTSVDVPEEDVYIAVKTLLEHQDDMLAVHGSAKYMTPENILNYNIPLHLGVIKYLEELGIEIPEELLPEEYNKK